MEDVTRTQHNEPRGNEMTNKQRNFEAGYQAGLFGVEFNPNLAQYIGYADGWDCGNCDRPTFDEMTPIDMAKERSTGCLL